MMKTLMYISIAVLLLEGCNSKQDQQIKSLSMQDSVLIRETAQKDSTITAHVEIMNEIQDNLDSIKEAEKMLTIGAFGSEHKTSAIQDIKNINAQILNYHKEIYSLEKRLKLVNSQNKEMQKWESHLTHELAEKDSDIFILQTQLAKTNGSLLSVMQQFNDSLVVICTLNGMISDLTTEMNTVYYTVGTSKEFKKAGVITKAGGFAGIGRAIELKKNFNTQYFTQTDMEKLSVIPLNGKFDKLVTNHPISSYTITNNHKSDSLIIKYPGLFWSISKYLVVVVK
ncbi:MAG: hypothetical protein ACLQQ4_06610 [Bacteroidia bacterium]